MLVFTMKVLNQILHAIQWEVLPEREDFVIVHVVNV